jgi:hypothetical protein
VSIAKDSLPPTLQESIPMEVFKAEVRSWADKIGVVPQAISIRPIKRK